MHLLHVANFLLLQKHEFKMEMTCEGCLNAAKRVLAKIGGIDNVLLAVSMSVACHYCAY